MTDRLLLDTHVALWLDILDVMPRTPDPGAFQFRLRRHVFKIEVW